MRSVLTGGLFLAGAWVAACGGDDTSAESDATVDARADRAVDDSGQTPDGQADGSADAEVDAEVDGGPVVSPECMAMVDAAQAFLATLEADEQMDATAMFGSNAHRQFEFLPPNSAARDGLSMRDMDDEEKAALAAFLQASMSTSGYMKLEQVRALESVLAMEESGMPVTNNRDPDNYFVQFFGTPAVDFENPWGFRFEGHHLSVQAGVVGCAVFTASPAFWGSSPNTTPLQAEIDAAEALWDSLDAGERGMARGNVNRDAIDAKEGSLAMIAVSGLPAGMMSPAQQMELRNIINAYIGNMAAPIAADRLAAIEDAGFDNIGFVYDDGDFRVLGPTFVIELVLVNPTHIHSAWRDYDGDYGDDLIARHMARHHHP
ncbi:MAG: DUF3500 domain-containing protein [Myxococcota bacterium]